MNLDRHEEKSMADVSSELEIFKNRRARRIEKSQKRRLVRNLMRSGKLDQTAAVC